MNKNILNFNAKREFHGYQELYNYQTNKLGLRVNYKNDNEIGYEENHRYKTTIFYIR